MSTDSHLMRIRFERLVLNCKKETYEIPFASRVTFFHGKIASGKSSVVRLVDFCLGGRLIKTSAIREELVSVSLSAKISKNDVVFERDVSKSGRIRVTWSGPSEHGSVSALVKGADKSPIWGENVYNLSDLLFHLFEVKPMKVRFSKRNSESKLVRLSFRDLAWYCYLKQEELISTFYNLDIPIYMNKSRTAMRFFVGDYTEKMAELEADLQAAKEERTEKKAVAKRLREFLSKFGYGSEPETRESIEKTEQELHSVDDKMTRHRSEFKGESHIVDDLRSKLRKLSAELDKERKTEADLIRRISSHESLLRELIGAKIRHARAETASRILSGVSFELCPSCGTRVRRDDEVPDGACTLCGKQPTPSEHLFLDFDLIQKDFSSRIEELHDSIEKQKRALIDQKEVTARVQEEKRLLDEDLERRMEEYDSAFLARFRGTERERGVIAERIRSLNEALRMVQAVEELEEEASTLLAAIETLERKVEEEKSTIVGVTECIRDIEMCFLEALIKTGVPGVSSQDTVKLDRNSWIPEIRHKGDPNKGWSFEEAGSAGKKTLLKTCYALAIHSVAFKQGLPVPQYLVIDSPMGHIDKEVDRDIFVSFYNHLYELLETSLSDTQVIIIDQEYVAPSSDTIDVRERFMTPDDPDNPPLIEYYRGP